MAAAKSKSADPPAEETRHAWEHPDYVAANQKLLNLRHRRDQTERALMEESDRIAEFRAGTHRQIKARALVFDEPIPRDPDINRDLGPLREEKQTLDEAVALAEKRLADVERRVSEAIVARSAPAYRDLVARQHAAAEALLAALQAEQDFVYDLESGGTRLGTMQRINVLTVDELRTRIESEFYDRAHIFHGMTLGPIPPITGFAASVRDAVPPPDPADWTG